MIQASCAVLQQLLLFFVVFTFGPRAKRGWEEF